MKKLLKANRVALVCQSSGHHETVMTILTQGTSRFPTGSWASPGSTQSEIWSHLALCTIVCLMEGFAD